MMWNNACPLLGWGANSSWGWIGMALNLLLWVGLIAGLIYLAVWLVRRTGAQLPVAAREAPGALTAREIAQRRYAQGDIEREEYLKLLDDLR